MMYSREREPLHRIRTRSAKTNCFVPPRLKFLFFPEIKRRAFDGDELSRWDSVTINSEDFRGIDLEVVPEDVGDVVLKSVEIPVHEII